MSDRSRQVKKKSRLSLVDSVPMAGCLCATGSSSAWMRTAVGSSWSWSNHPGPNDKCDGLHRQRRESASCEWCGGRNTRPRSEYCTSARGRRAIRAALRASRLRRTCLECGGPMAATRSSAVFCSSACRSRHHRKASPTPSGSALFADQPTRRAISWRPA